MKFALALLALVATASAFELPNFGRGYVLHKDIQEFIDLVPLEKVIQITLQYFTEDKDFQRMIEYFRSEEFKQLVKEVEALPEVKVFMDYVHNAGIDIYKMVNDLNSALKLPPLTAPSYFGTYITGGINGYIQDILNVLPQQQLRDLYEKKLKTSEAFADLVAQLKSDNFQQLVNQIYNNPIFQELLTHARTEGIDLIKIKNLLESLWGIKIPTY